VTSAPQRRPRIGSGSLRRLSFVDSAETAGVGGGHEKDNSPTGMRNAVMLLEPSALSRLVRVTIAVQTARPHPSELSPSAVSGRVWQSPETVETPIDVIL